MEDAEGLREDVDGRDSLLGVQGGAGRGADGKKVPVPEGGSGPEGHALQQVHVALKAGRQGGDRSARSEAVKRRLCYNLGIMTNKPLA